MGTVYDITWEEGQDPFICLPYVILIEFDNYSGLEFPSCSFSVVLVFVELRRFDYKSIACTRKQFPLRLAYSITVHKSQGLTLSKAVLNLAAKEHALGLLYVAVSRVKKLSGLLFECPFNFDHFQPPTSESFKDRALDVIERNKQII